MTAAQTSSALHARWKALAPREQALLASATALVLLALLWWLALAPALQTLRTAPARHAALDQQVQRMQSLQAEAQQLQGAPRAAATDVVGQLRATLTQRLPGTAQLQASGDRVTVTLKGAPADGLAQWMSQARANARATPVEARLSRAADAAAPRPGATKGAAAADPANTLPRWDGTLVLALPPSR